MNEKEKLELETIEKAVMEHSEFNGCKIIHCGRRNAIVFNKEGKIGVFTDGIKSIKKIDINDIKKIQYKKVKDDDTKEWFCILTINDFDTPIIKLLLSFDTEDNAPDLYNEIKGKYLFLKEQEKNK